jgi:hypothetical protein
MDNDPDERQAFHIEEDDLQPVGPGRDPADTTSFDPTRLDFGHYAGSSIEELARIDPEYLSWLVRHPSGSRYRAEIRRVLGVAPSMSDWNR